MTIYLSRHRFMLMLTIVRRKTFNTLKSRHDQQNDQDLLKRLKNISVIGEKKTTFPPTPPNEVVQKDSIEKPERSLTFDRLSKLVRFHQTDPLTWNPSILGRIFNIPEFYCEKLLIYCRPMVFYSSPAHRESQKLISTTYVVDVGRLKSDDNYLVTYKKIVFPEQAEKLPKEALE